MPGHRHPGRSPGPLDNLPRPLDERDRRGRGHRLAAKLAIGAALVVVGGAAVTSWRSGELSPVGAVQGAVGSPGRPELDGVSLGAAALATPTVRITPTPPPTPTPTPTPAPTPAPPESLTGYQSPLPHGRLTLPFGPSAWGSRMVDGTTFHDGIDLATFCGDRVVAAHDGNVLAAGRRYDDQMGWIGDLRSYKQRLDKRHAWMTLPIVIVIDDGNGYRSIYAHFGKVVVKRGQAVRAGQLIGYEGQTGRASGCHLHYGLFSPLETATFEIDPDVVKRMKVPQRQIARIDPLRVLPQHAPKASPSPSSGRPATSPRQRLR
jgi:murein DD-endopeptidase MepM/ murein hydrolase activator NlpD